MSDLLDRCPACGDKSLVAVCTVTAEYAIANDGEDAQDWLRREVYDDTSEARSVRCEACGAEYADVRLDDRGYLIGLAVHPDDQEAAEVEWWFAAVAYGDRDQGDGHARLFTKLYDHEPCEAEVRRDAFEQALPGWMEVYPTLTVRDANEEWEAGLHDPMVIRVQRFPCSSR